MLSVEKDHKRGLKVRMQRVYINKANAVRGRAVLEVLLLLAALSLVLQLFPSAISSILSPLYRALWTILDVRSWTSWGWFAANAVLFVVLCGMRFGPEMVTNVVASLRDKGYGQRTAKRQSREAINEKLRLAEERALYQRMIEARKRQII